MRRLLAIVLVLSLTMTALAARVAAQQPTHAYRVIINPKNPATAVDKQFLQDAFLKKVTRWPNDYAIQPADLHATSAVRDAFSKEVLNRSIAAIKAYWQQRIFSGRGVPPPEFSDERAAVAYVLAHDGGLAYVSGNVDLGGAKVVVLNR
jgi:hypothetical protein